MKEESIKNAKLEFPEAIVVMEDKGSWRLSCSKCGQSYYFPSAGIDDEVFVLQDACIFDSSSMSSIRKKYGIQEPPHCGGKTTYILVK